MFKYNMEVEQHLQKTCITKAASIFSGGHKKFNDTILKKPRGVIPRILVALYPDYINYNRFDYLHVNVCWSWLCSHWLVDFPPANIEYIS